MGDVIDLLQGRRHIAAKRGFSAWYRRFGRDFDELTSPKDLSDAVLFQLIQGDDVNGGAIKDFVLGVLNPGTEDRQRQENSAAMMAVMDVILFVLDQLRFEAMRRLGWVSENPLTTTSLLTMVEDFQTKYAATRHQTPALAPAHPLHQAYLETFEADRGSFIRKLTPEVLTAFEQRVRRQSPPEV